MCNPEILINLNLPKLYHNYLKPVPRLKVWDLGIGNFTPSVFPGFEWVRNNKIKANLLMFPETSIRPIFFCNFGSKCNVPLSLVLKRSYALHKRKEYTKAACTTEAINSRNLIESFENIPVPPPPQPVSFSLGLSFGAFSARCLDWDSKFTLSECLPYSISCCS